MIGDMVRRGRAVHVASIKAKRKGRTYVTHLLRRTYREDGKVKHQTLGNLSHLPPPVIELIKGSLLGQIYVPISEAVKVVRSLPHGHVAAILGTVKKLGMPQLLAARPSRQRDLAMAMIVSRVLAPSSKLATYRALAEETQFTTLGKALELGEVEERELYHALDWLVGRQGWIEKKLARRHLRDGCLVLYDLTSSYYTGSHCPLAEFGYNRDGKKRFPQVAWGLLCTGDGCPVAVEVFEGNVADSETLSSQIKKVQKRFGVERVVVVGDRGMIMEARIREDLASVEGLDWITALRAPAIQALAQQGAIQFSLFDQRDLAEITSPDYPGERLIACRNPLLAAERTRKREELLEATEKELNKIAAATKRKRGRLAGKEQIGLRVGKVLNHYKVGKHFELRIADEGFEYERDVRKIAAEAALDGIYVIRTSVPVTRFSAEDTVRAYKDLSAVERAFRSLKTVDLKVRPFFHRLAERIRGHVLLCMLAFYVEWHMRRSLAPLLFDDEEPKVAESLRASIVSPAMRSLSAQRKAQRKRTDDGLPVYSFQTLLKDLAQLPQFHI
ncbi:MAG: IS1634 family transposase [Dehalococcoidia bacterium]|nr:IS1634 family transposase [Dehalococcoidia bacterium]